MAKNKNQRIDFGWENNFGVKTSEDIKDLQEVLQSLNVAKEEYDQYSLSKIKDASQVDKLYTHILTKMNKDGEIEKKIGLEIKRKNDQIQNIQKKTMEVRKVINDVTDGLIQDKEIISRNFLDNQGKVIDEKFFTPKGLSVRSNKNEADPLKVLEEKKKILENSLHERYKYSASRGTVGVEEQIEYFEGFDELYQDQYDEWGKTIDYIDTVIQKINLSNRSDEKKNKEIKRWRDIQDHARKTYQKSAHKNNGTLSSVALNWADIKDGSAKISDFDPYYNLQTAVETMTEELNEKYSTLKGQIIADSKKDYSDKIKKFANGRFTLGKKSTKVEKKLSKDTHLEHIQKTQNLDSDALKELEHMFEKGVSVIGRAKEYYDAKYKDTETPQIDLDVARKIRTAFENVEKPIKEVETRKNTRYSGQGVSISNRMKELMNSTGVKTVMDLPKKLAYFDFETIGEDKFATQFSIRYGDQSITKFFKLTEEKANDIKETLDKLKKSDDGKDNLSRQEKMDLYQMADYSVVTSPDKTRRIVAKHGDYDLSKAIPKHMIQRIEDGFEIMSKGEGIVNLLEYNDTELGVRNFLNTTLKSIIEKGYVTTGHNIRTFDNSVFKNIGVDEKLYSNFIDSFEVVKEFYQHGSQRQGKDGKIKTLTGHTLSDLADFFEIDMEKELKKQENKNITQHTADYDTLLQKKIFEKIIKHSNRIKNLNTDKITQDKKAFIRQGNVMVAARNIIRQGSNSFKIDEVGNVDTSSYGKLLMERGGAYEFLGANNDVIDKLVSSWRNVDTGELVYTEHSDMGDLANFISRVGDGIAFNINDLEQKKKKKDRNEIENPINLKDRAFARIFNGKHNKLNGYQLLESFYEQFNSEQTNATSGQKQLFSNLDKDKDFKDVIFKLYEQLNDENLTNKEKDFILKKAGSEFITYGEAFTESTIGHLAKIKAEDTVSSYRAAYAEILQEWRNYLPENVYQTALETLKGWNKMSDSEIAEKNGFHWMNKMILDNLNQEEFMKHNNKLGFLNIHRNQLKKGKGQEKKTIDSFVNDYVDNFKKVFPKNKGKTMAVDSLLENGKKLWGQEFEDALTGNFKKTRLDKTKKFGRDSKEWEEYERAYDEATNNQRGIQGNSASILGQLKELENFFMSSKHGKGYGMTLLPSIDGKSIKLGLYSNRKMEDYMTDGELDIEKMANAVIPLDFGDGDIQKGYQRIVNVFSARNDGTREMLTTLNENAFHSLIRKIMMPNSYILKSLDDDKIGLGSWAMRKAINDELVAPSAGTYQRGSDFVDSYDATGATKEQLFAKRTKIGLNGLVTRALESIGFKSDSDIEKYRQDAIQYMYLLNAGLTKDAEGSLDVFLRDALKLPENKNVGIDAIKKRFETHVGRLVNPYLFNFNLSADKEESAQEGLVSMLTARDLDPSGILHPEANRGIDQSTNNLLLKIMKGFYSYDFKNKTNENVLKKYGVYKNSFTTDIGNINSDIINYDALTHGKFETIQMEEDGLKIVYEEGAKRLQEDIDNELKKTTPDVEKVNEWKKQISHYQTALKNGLYPSVKNDSLIIDKEFAEMLSLESRSHSLKFKDAEEAIRVLRKFNFDDGDKDLQDPIRSLGIGEILKIKDGEDRRFKKISFSHNGKEMELNSNHMFDKLEKRADGTYLMTYTENKKFDAGTKALFNNRGTFMYLDHYLANIARELFGGGFQTDENGNILRDTEGNKLLKSSASLFIPKRKKSKMREQDLMLYEAGDLYNTLQYAKRYAEEKGIIDPNDETSVENFKNVLSNVLSKNTNLMKNWIQPIRKGTDILFNSGSYEQDGVAIDNFGNHLYGNDIYDENGKIYQGDDATVENKWRLMWQKGYTLNGIRDDRTRLEEGLDEMFHKEYGLAKNSFKNRIPENSILMNFRPANDPHYFKPTGTVSQEDAEKYSRYKVSKNARDSLKRKVGLYSQYLAPEEKTALEEFYEPFTSEKSIDEVAEKLQAEYGGMLTRNLDFMSGNGNKIVEEFANGENVIRLVRREDSNTDVSGNEIDLADKKINGLNKPTRINGAFSEYDWNTTPVGSILKKAREEGKTGPVRVVLSLNTKEHPTKFDRVSGETFKDLQHLALVVDDPEMLSNGSVSPSQMDDLANKVIRAYYDGSEDLGKIYENYQKEAFSQVKNKNSELWKRNTSKRLGNASAMKLTGMNYEAFIGKKGLDLSTLGNTIFLNDKHMRDMMLTKNRSENPEILERNIENLQFMYENLFESEIANKTVDSFETLKKQKTDNKGNVKLNELEDLLVKRILDASNVDKGGTKSLSGLLSRYPYTSGLDISHSRVQVTSDESAVAYGHAAINPGLARIFNGDFDGDTSYIHLPWLSQEIDIDKMKKAWSSYNTMLQQDDLVSQMVGQEVLNEYLSEKGQSKEDPQAIEDAWKFIAKEQTTNRLNDKIAAIIAKFNFGKVGGFSNIASGVREALRIDKRDEMSDGISLAEKQDALTVRAFFEMIEQDAISAKHVKKRLTDKHKGDDGAATLFHELSNFYTLLTKGHMLGEEDTVALKGDAWRKKIASYGQNIGIFGSDDDFLDGRQGQIAMARMWASANPNTKEGLAFRQKLINDGVVKFDDITDENNVHKDKFDHVGKISKEAFIDALGRVDPNNDLIFRHYKARNSMGKISENYAFDNFVKRGMKNRGIGEPNPDEEYGGTDTSGYDQRTEAINREAKAEADKIRISKGLETQWNNESKAAGNVKGIIARDGALRSLRASLEDISALGEVKAEFKGLQHLYKAHDGKKEVTSDMSNAATVTQIADALFGADYDNSSEYSAMYNAMNHLIVEGSLPDIFKRYDEKGKEISFEHTKDDRDYFEQFANFTNMNDKDKTNMKKLMTSTLVGNMTHEMMDVLRKNKISDVGILTDEKIAEKAGMKNVYDDWQKQYTDVYKLQADRLGVELSSQPAEYLTRLSDLGFADGGLAEKSLAIKFGSEGNEHYLFGTLDAYVNDLLIDYKTTGHIDKRKMGYQLTALRELMAAHGQELVDESLKYGDGKFAKSNADKDGIFSIDQFMNNFRGVIAHTLDKENKAVLYQMDLMSKEEFLDYTSLYYGNAYEPGKVQWDPMDPRIIQSAFMSDYNNKLPLSKLIDQDLKKDMDLLEKFIPIKNKRDLEFKNQKKIFLEDDDEVRKLIEQSKEVKERNAPIIERNLRRDALDRDILKYASILNDINNGYNTDEEKRKKTEKANNILRKYSTEDNEITNIEQLRALRNNMGIKERLEESNLKKMKKPNAGILAINSPSRKIENIFSLDSSTLSDQNLIELAKETFKLERGYSLSEDVLTPEESSVIKTRLRKARKILKKNNIDTMNLEGQRYDGGLSVDVVSRTTPEGTSGEIVSDMIEPIVLKDGAVIEFGKVGVGTEVRKRLKYSKTPDMGKALAAKIWQGVEESEAGQIYRQFVNENGIPTGDEHIFYNAELAEQRIRREVIAENEHKRKTGRDYLEGQELEDEILARQERDKAVKKRTQYLEKHPEVYSTMGNIETKENILMEAIQQRANLDLELKKLQSQGYDISKDSSAYEVRSIYDKIGIIEGSLTPELKKRFDEYVANYESSDEFKKMENDVTLGGYKDFIVSKSKSNKSRKEDYKNLEDTLFNVSDLRSQIAGYEKLKAAEQEGSEAAQNYARIIELLNNALNQSIAKVAELDAKYGKDSKYEESKKKAEENVELTERSKKAKEDLKAKEEEDKKHQRENKSNASRDKSNVLSYLNRDTDLHKKEIELDGLIKKSTGSKKEELQSRLLDIRKQREELKENANKTGAVSAKWDNDTKEMVYYNKDGKETSRETGNAAQNSYRQIYMAENKNKEKINEAYMKANKKGFFGNIADSVKGAAHYMMFTSLGYSIIGSIRGEIQKIIQQTKQLEKTMTDLRIVTGGSEKQVQDLMYSYQDLGSQLGLTTAEVAASANEWLRMGYNAEQANTMIYNSAMLAKLGMIDTAKATEYMVSAVKGYNVAIEDAEQIVDMATALDMKYAVSAGYILEAMARTASGAKLAKVEMSELQSLIAVIGETTQKDASVIGESLKTAFSRYANVKATAFVNNPNLSSDENLINQYKLETEASESGDTTAVNDIEKVLKVVDIDIRNGEEWRSYSDILKEIGQSWKTYSDYEKNAIVTAMFGTRQRENGIVALTNYNRVLEANELAINSVGTATQKMEIYSQGLEAAQNRVTAAWEKLVMDLEAGGVIQNTSEMIESLIKNFEWLAKVVGGGLLFANLDKVLVALTKFSVLFNSKMAMGTNLFKGFFTGDFSGFKERMSKGVDKAYDVAKDDGVNVKNPELQENTNSLNVLTKSIDRLNQVLSTYNHKNPNGTPPVLTPNGTTPNGTSPNGTHPSGGWKISKKSYKQPESSRGVFRRSSNSFSVKRILEDREINNGQNNLPRRDRPVKVKQNVNVNKTTTGGSQKTQFIINSKKRTTNPRVAPTWSNNTAQIFDDSELKEKRQTIGRSIGTATAGVTGFIGGGMIGSAIAEAAGADETGQMIGSMIGGGIISQTASTIAMSGHPIVGAAIGIGSLIIGGIINGIKKDREQVQRELTEALAKTEEEYNNLTSMDTQDKVSKYDELAQGVNSLGENVSLTSAQYDEFLSLSNELGEMFPSLISRTDAFGNSILDVGDDVDSLSEKLKQMTDITRNELIEDYFRTKTSHGENLSAAGEVFNDVKKQAEKNRYEHLGTEAASVHFTKAKGLMAIIDQSVVDFDEIMKEKIVKKALEKGIKFSKDLYDDKGNIGSMSSAFNDLVENNPAMYVFEHLPELKEYMEKKLFEKSEKYKKTEMVKNTADYRSKVIEDIIGFKDIDGELSTFLMNLTAGVDVTEFENEEDYRKFLQDNIISKYSNNDNVVDAFNNLKENENDSTKKISEYVNDYTENIGVINDVMKQNIESMDVEKRKEFYSKYGLTYDETTGKLTNAIGEFVSEDEFLEDFTGFDNKSANIQENITSKLMSASVKKGVLTQNPENFDIINNLTVEQGQYLSNLSEGAFSKIFNDVDFTDSNDVSKALDNYFNENMIGSLFSSKQKLDKIAKDYNLTDQLDILMDNFNDENYQNFISHLTGEDKDKFENYFKDLKKWADSLGISFEEAYKKASLFTSFDKYGYSSKTLTQVETEYENVKKWRDAIRNGTLSPEMAEEMFTYAPDAAAVLYDPEQADAILADKYDNKHKLQIGAIKTGYRNSNKYYEDYLETEEGKASGLTNDLFKNIADGIHFVEKLQPYILESGEVDLTTEEDQIDAIANIMGEDSYESLDEALKAFANAYGVEEGQVITLIRNEIPKFIKTENTLWGSNADSKISKDAESTEVNNKKAYREAAKDLAYAQRDIKRATEDYNEKQEDLAKQKRLASLEKELSERAMIIQRYTNAINNSDWMLDLLPENDYEGRIEATGEKLGSLTEKNIELKKQMENVAKTVPQSADEAQKLKEEYDKLNSELLENEKSIIAVEKELNKLTVEAMTSPFTESIKLFEKQQKALDDATSLMTSTVDVEGSWRFAAFEGLYDFTEQSKLDKKREEYDELLNAQREYQEKSLEMEQTYLNMKDKETTDDINKEIQRSSEDYEKTIEDFGQKCIDFVNTYKDTLEEIYGNTENILPKIFKKFGIEQLPKYLFDSDYDWLKNGIPTNPEMIDVDSLTFDANGDIVYDKDEKIEKAKSKISEYLLETFVPNELSKGFFDENNPNSGGLYTKDDIIYYDDGKGSKDIVNEYTWDLINSGSYKGLSNDELYKIVYDLIKNYLSTVKKEDNIEIPKPTAGATPTAYTPNGVPIIIPTNATQSGLIPTNLTNTTVTGLKKTGQEVSNKIFGNNATYPISFPNQWSKDLGVILNDEVDTAFEYVNSEGKTLNAPIPDMNSWLYFGELIGGYISQGIQNGVLSGESKIVEESFTPSSPTGVTYLGDSDSSDVVNNDPIQKGQTLYFHSKTSPKYGHVGIYDGNGGVYHRAGGKGYSHSSFAKMTSGGAYTYVGAGWNGGNALTDKEADLLIENILANKVEDPGQGYCQKWVARAYETITGDYRSISSPEEAMKTTGWILTNAFPNSYSNAFIEKNKIEESQNKNGLLLLIEKYMSEYKPSDIGWLSQKYEGNVGTISNNPGDYGGKSYGIPQFSLNMGSLQSFIDWLDKRDTVFATPLIREILGSDAFDKAWKLIAEKEPNKFSQYQSEYAYNTMAIPQAKKIYDIYGIDMTRSPILREALISMAYQYNNLSSKLLNGANDKMTDEELINLIYSNKLGGVDSHFKSSSSKIKDDIRNRIPREQAELLKYYGYANGTDYHPGGLALVGDENLLEGNNNPSPETVIYPDGSVELVGQNGAELRNLPKGTEVLTTEETKKIRSYADRTNDNSTTDTTKTYSISLTNDELLTKDEAYQKMYKSAPSYLNNVAKILEDEWYKNIVKTYNQISIDNHAIIKELSPVLEQYDKQISETADSFEKKELKTSQALLTNESKALSYAKQLDANNEMLNYLMKQYDENIDKWKADGDYEAINAMLESISKVEDEIVKNTESLEKYVEEIYNVAAGVYELNEAYREHTDKMLDFATQLGRIGEKTEENYWGIQKENAKKSVETADNALEEAKAALYRSVIAQGGTYEEYLSRLETDETIQKAEETAQQARVNEKQVYTDAFNYFIEQLEKSFEKLETSMASVSNKTNALLETYLLSDKASKARTKIDANAEMRRRLTEDTLSKEEFDELVLKISQNNNEIIAAVDEYIQGVFNNASAISTNTINQLVSSEEAGISRNKYVTRRGQRRVDGDFYDEQINALENKRDAYVQAMVDYEASLIKKAEITGQSVEELKAVDENWNTYLQGYNETLSEINSKHNEELEAKLNLLDIEQQILDLNKQTEWSSIRNINEYYDQTQYILEQKRDDLIYYMEVTKMSEDEYLEKQKQLAEIEKQIIDSKLEELQAKQSFYNEQYNAMTFMVNEYTQALTEEKERVSDYYDEEIRKLQQVNDSKERSIKLTELQNNLENAQKEKKRVYRTGVGFVYEQDREAVKKAEDELDAFYRQDQLDSLNDAKEMELRILDERIEGWNKYLEAIEKVYKTAERHHNMELLKTMFGIEGDVNWDNIFKFLDSDMSNYLTNKESGEHIYYGELTSWLENYDWTSSAIYKKLNEIHDVLKNSPALKGTNLSAEEAMNGKEVSDKVGKTLKEVTKEEREFKEYIEKSNGKYWRDVVEQFPEITDFSKLTTEEMKKYGIKDEAEKMALHNQKEREMTEWVKSGAIFDREGNIIDYDESHKDIAAILNGSLANITNWTYEELAQARVLKLQLDKKISAADKEKWMNQDVGISKENLLYLMNDPEQNITDKESFIDALMKTYKMSASLANEIYSDALKEILDKDIGSLLQKTDEEIFNETNGLNRSFAEKVLNIKKSNINNLVSGSKDIGLLLEKSDDDIFTETGLGREAVEWAKTLKQNKIDDLIASGKDIGTLLTKSDEEILSETGLSRSSVTWARTLKQNIIDDLVANTTDWESIMMDNNTGLSLQDVKYAKKLQDEKLENYAKSDKVANELPLKEDGTIDVETIINTNDTELVSNMEKVQSNTDLAATYLGYIASRMGYKDTVGEVGPVLPVDNSIAGNPYLTKQPNAESLFSKNFGGNTYIDNSVKYLVTTQQSQLTRAVQGTTNLGHIDTNKKS